MSVRFLRTKIVAGFASRALGQFVQIVLKLIEVPICLHYWGAETYGLWLLLNSVPGLLVVSDLGLIGPSGRDITRLLSSNRSVDAGRLFWSSIAATTLSSSLIGVIAFSVISSGSNVFPLLAVAQSSARPLLMLLAGVPISFLAQALYGASESSGRYAHGYAFLIVANLARSLAIYVVVMRGGSLYTAALAGLVAQVASLSLQWVWSFSQIKWLAFSGFNFSALLTLRRPAAAQVLLTLAQALSYEGPRLLLGALAGPAAVVVFVVHRQLARVALIVNNFNGPLIAEMAIASGRNDKARFLALGLSTARFLAWGTFLVLVVTTFAGQAIFLRWSGGKISFNPLVYGLLAGATLAEAIWRCALVPLYAVNRHFSLSLWYFAAIGVAAAIGIPLTIAAPVVGTALSILVMELIINVGAMGAVSRVLEITRSTWLLNLTALPVRRRWYHPIFFSGEN